MTRTVLISGASIAGPTPAYWLHRHGFRPIVIERSATVRSGGYPIDVRTTASDLVGDAAHAPALLSGQGTSLAMVGAYVLAGELAAADGDPDAAFAGYERVMRPYTDRNQSLAGLGGAALIPRTRTMLWLRNRLLTVLPHLGTAKRLLGGRIDQAARSLGLHDYARAATGSRQLDRRP